MRYKCRKKGNVSEKETKKGYYKCNPLILKAPPSEETAILIFN